MITRLRPKHTEETLRSIYNTPHNHTNWHDHSLRVAATIALARFCENINSIADLSCGNASIVRSLADEDFYIEEQNMHLGDYASSYQYEGPIEQTISLIPKVDMFVCCETLEHLDNPQEVLYNIREKTNHLVLSTPVENWNDGNIEHYWSWDRPGVEELLNNAGFTVTVYNALDFRHLGPAYYCFGIWICS